MDGKSPGMGNSTGRDLKHLRTSSISTSRLLYPFVISFTGAGQP